MLIDKLRRIMTVCLLVWLALPSAGAGADFQLGLQDNGMIEAPSAPTLARDYRVLQQIRGTTVRIALPWSSLAPQGRTKPQGFDAYSSADPHYASWPNSADIWVKDAAQHGAQVMLTITGAPRWAQGPHPPPYIKQYGGSWEPSPRELGAFAHAAAVRYSGRFPDPERPGTFLPHVRYWEVWNEENLPQDLGAPNLIEEYRAMLNATYSGIKSVDRRDQVEVGGLAPVSFETGSIRPLRFAAQLMCLRRVGQRFVRTGQCPTPAHFDIFGIHPYSLAATPTKHAYHYDDVLVGDMGKVSTLVSTADQLHTVAPRAHHPIWVTEWSWFTNPPDNVVGDSGSTAARYVDYSIYEMWRSGVSMVMWFLVQDPNLKASNSPAFVLGGGLYDRFGRAKLMLRAFDFALVASVQRGTGVGWGRAPFSGPILVTIQRLVKRRWEPVTVLRTGSDGVFYARFHARSNGFYRAQLPGNVTSLAYDSRPIPPVRTHLFYSG